MDLKLDINNSKLIKSILNLESIDTNLYRANYTTKKNHRGIFGGQIIGQALMAANDTVPNNMNVHSMHAYFILPGDSTLPVIYNIEITRDGRSFCTRIVKAIQKGKMIFSAMVSYQKLELISYTFQIKMPDVPNPESIPLYQDFMAENSNTIFENKKEFISSYLKRDFSFDIKLANFDWLSFLSNDIMPNNQPVRLLFWIKFKDNIDEANWNLHKSVVGYISDSYLLQSALIALPHGKYDLVTFVSLDHSLWFHQQFDGNDWLLLDCENTRYENGRALTNGRIWTRDGKLVVSISQEGLIRLKSKI